MENENNGHLIPNDPITAELQTQAVKAFRDADKAEGLKRSSRVMLVYCLIQAAQAPLEAIVKNAKGETEFSHAFTIADFCDAEHVKAACGDNNRAKGAMVKAVTERLAGVADPSPAQKQALSQAAPVAFGLVGRLSEEGTPPDEAWQIAAERVTLSKRGTPQVPGFVMLKEPDAEKASESELERYSREKDVPMTLDGTKGRSFNELSSRVRPKVERPDGAGAGQGADAGKALSRLDAAKVLLRGAVGGDDYAVYLADLSAAELLVALRTYSETNGDAE